MAWVDENGCRHPTPDDELELTAMLHIAFCPQCSQYALPMPELPLAIPVR